MDVRLVSGLLLFAIFTAIAGDCPNGWTRHDDSCYLYVKEAYYWFSAEVACGLLGGYLVEINSAEENTVVAGLIHSHGDQITWIGLSDLAAEGKFILATSQEPTEWTNWAPGQPDDERANEDCANMRPTGEWNDSPCQGINFPFICEKGYDDERGLIG